MRARGAGRDGSGTPGYTAAIGINRANVYKTLQSSKEIRRLFFVQLLEDAGLEMREALMMDVSSQ